MEQQVWSRQLARQSTLRPRVAGRHAGDGLQRPLRSRFQPRLMPGVRLPLCKLCTEETEGDLSRADGSRMMSHGRLLLDTDLALGKS